MTKFFNKFKNPVFGPFSQFLGQNFPPTKSGSVTTSYRFLAPCQNFKKLIIQFQENVQTDRRTEGRKDRWKDGQTLFHRTLLATTAGPIIYQMAVVKEGI